MLIRSALPLILHAGIVRSRQPVMYAPALCYACRRPLPGHHETATGVPERQILYTPACGWLPQRKPVAHSG